MNVDLRKRDIVKLGTAISLAEWYVRRMPRSRNRIGWTNSLRSAWSAHRKLTDAFVNSERAEGRTTYEVAR